jgi:hypothetical protein
MAQEVLDGIERMAVLLDRQLITLDEFHALKQCMLTDLSSPVGGCRRRLGAAGKEGSARPEGAKKAKYLAHCIAAESGGSSDPARNTLVWLNYDEIFTMHVLQFLDVGVAMRCRLVCSRWKRAVSVAGLDPLEAGKSSEEVQRGCLEQRWLCEQQQREDALWMDWKYQRRFIQLSNDLEQQAGLNAKMRQILVDWLLELHWNTFESCMQYPGVVHLAVQLVDRFIAAKQVSRSNFQAVGAIAFGIACAARECKGLEFTERHCAIARSLQGNDMRVTKEYLIYMCANAVNQRDFDKIENDMLCCLRHAPAIPSANSSSCDALSSLGCSMSVPYIGAGHRVGAYEIIAHPRPCDFVNRFIRAARIEPLASFCSQVPLDCMSILIFLLDVVLVRQPLHPQPSTLNPQPSTLPLNPKSSTA